MTKNSHTHVPISASRASFWLLLATISWGLSFPLIKCMNQTQLELFPEASSWFLSAYIVFLRFFVAGFVLIILLNKKILTLTRNEWAQGFLLGFFACIGLVLQADGLSYTSSSVSAFLTQFYCLILPIVACVQVRKWLPLRVWISSLLVLTGVALLSNFHWGELHMGRGEFETILASCFFAVQILVLENKKFSHNRSDLVSMLMFFVIALGAFPLLIAETKNPQWLMSAFVMPAVGFQMFLLIAFCTLFSFVAMNKFQPFVESYKAGLIYSSEPIFATLCALFLPAILGAIFAQPYINEPVTGNLLIGGLLILSANLIVQGKQAK